MIKVNNKVTELPTGQEDSNLDRLLEAKRYHPTELTDPCGGSCRR